MTVGRLGKSFLKFFFSPLFFFWRCVSGVGFFLSSQQTFYLFPPHFAERKGRKIIRMNTNQDVIFFSLHTRKAFKIEKSILVLAQTPRKSFLTRLHIKKLQKCKKKKKKCFGDVPPPSQRSFLPRPPPSPFLFHPTPPPALQTLCFSHRLPFPVYTRLGTQPVRAGRENAGFLQSLCGEGLQSECGSRGATVHFP